MERKLELETLNVEELVKKNNMQPVTNPIFFSRNGVPSDDGLLSNTIFGVTKEERSGIFAYIDLQDWFLDPLSYRIWGMMDNKIKACVHGTKKFKIQNGELVEDENGGSGVNFLRLNFEKLKIKETDSSKRTDNIKFIETNYKAGTLFIKKYVVIPAFYRDVNSGNTSVGVGDVNKLYDSLIIAVNSIREAKDYGIQLSYSVNGRIQEILLNIYNWFTAEPNIGKKFGIIRRAVLSKTADYASRLVLSAPNLRVENLEDLIADVEHVAVPMASLCSNLYPFVLFWIRRFFENEFAGRATYPVIKKGAKEVTYLPIKDIEQEFSDNKIKKQLDRFIRGWSNRFIPVEIPVMDEKNKNAKYYMQFRGNHDKQDNIKDGDVNTSPIANRRLTWCDLIYMACVDMSADKVALITRYPINDYFGQFPQKIRVSSTKETEPMYVNLYGEMKFYKNYPMIREEDIEDNTSNKFIDTLNMCNVHLKIIGGDYDGDQVTIKIAYTEEANEELRKYIESKGFYVGLGASAVRESSNEAIQTIYNLTLVLSDTQLSDPIF